MLRTCGTVSEALAYLRAQRDDPALTYARLLIADASGASAIVGPKKGEITVEPAATYRGFGFGARILNKRLAVTPAATLNNATDILAACHQRLPLPATTTIYLRPGDNRVRAEEFEALKVKRVALVQDKVEAHYSQGDLREDFGFKAAKDAVFASGAKVNLYSRCFRRSNLGPCAFLYCLWCR